MVRRISRTNPRPQSLRKRSTCQYREVTCLNTRKTPADQGFYAYSGFGFWLLQGQWDRSAQEFEGPALGGGGYGEQVETGRVVAGDA
jgi:hypothetical protein